MLNAIPRSWMLVAIIMLLALATGSVTMLFVGNPFSSGQRDTAIEAEHSQVAYEFERWMEDHRPDSWPPAEEGRLVPLKPGEDAIERACQKESIDCAQLRRYVDFCYLQGGYRYGVDWCLRGSR